MSKRKIFILLSLTFFLTGALFAFLSKGKQKMVKMETLESGLKVLVKNNPSNEIVALHFFAGGGSGVESSAEAGLTNLTARLLFKGTRNKDFTRIAEEFDFLGALWGLSVERDFSEIHLVIPRKFWKEGLKLFAEVLTTPEFSQDEIAKEKGLIIQQIKSIDDDAFEFTYRAFNENIYGRHPYAKPTFGFPGTVSQFTRDDIIRQYQKCFCSQNAILTFVGNLEPKEVIKEVKENFPGLPSGRPLQLNDEPFQDGENRRIIKKADLKQAMMFLGFRVPGVKDKDYSALKLISAFLGGGMSSRLFENVRDKEGIGYALGTFYSTRLGASTFIFYLGVLPQRLKKAELAFWTEIEKMKFEDISEEEFRKTKNYLIGNFHLSQQRNKAQGYYLGWFETMGLGHNFGTVYLENVESVQIGQIKEAAKKYFTKENTFLLILEPE